jgi:omega-6 fatty acid desaturase (delta-12 desaturase)
MKDISKLNAILAKYKEPNMAISLRQIANTAGPFFAVTVLMHMAHHYHHPWLAFFLAFPAAGLLGRLFIIQHDCGHGSFFKSARANDMLGAVLGVITLTPYSYWKQTHAIHHATSGNLDRRGFGDINTLTVAEFNALSTWGQWKYRMYRSFPILFVIGPSFHFTVYHRLPTIIPSEWKAERLSILLTDLVLVSILAVASYTIGLVPFLIVQLPVNLIAATAGVYMFYVQHQFEGAYWAHDKDWDLSQASLSGSSYYELPWVLQWITGNIGFHHIHHLNSRIPNYALPRVMKENPVFQQAVKMTPWKSLKCFSLTLWDEKLGKLVPFDGGVSAGV